MVATWAMRSGLEVGAIEYLGLPQALVEGVRFPKSEHLVWDRDKLLLGAIVEVLPHPNADRLVLAMVDYGGDALEQCVTGAPNLYEYKGLGPLASIQAIGSGEEVQILFNAKIAIQRKFLRHVAERLTRLRAGGAKIMAGNAAFARCRREKPAKHLEGRGFAASGREPLHHVREAVRSQRLRTDGGHRHHVHGSAGGLGSGDNHL